ncbi:MAG TPA: peptide ABC transporter permease [Nitrospiraceae bacterium]|nr:peptide ABC transporter permease [Nitrospiraceae bacterium]HCL81833.1 peptide ABC transporter permease [Nitrospiraceae bacterium]
MMLSRVINISLKGLSKYKMRTFLMMLGIIIGIATLTVIVSVSKGMQKKVMKSIQSFGSNAVMVSAGGGKMFGPPDEKVTSLTLDDADAIREQVKGIRAMSPFTMALEQTVIYGSKNTMSPVVGVTPEFADAWQWYAEKGDFISDEDNSSMSKNCMLGQTVVSELFGDQDPVGETIRVNNTNFKIIGVLSKRGTSPRGMDMDRRVMVPLTTAMKRLYNVTYIGMIRLYIDDSSRLDEVSKTVASILKERHHITPPQEDDFRVTNTMAMANMAKGVSKTLGTFLALLSLISLAVGGIVIANIMFISVNERKKEIGIRRAFGATAVDIRKQFLGEALFVTIGGGIVGTALGIIVSEGLATIKKMPVVISWEPFALAIVFSTLVGIIAGLQPAKRAAAMDPVDAIRG